MLRVVQGALADVAEATYEVRDLCVVREEWANGDRRNRDVGLVPCERRFFANVTRARQRFPSSLNDLTEKEFQRCESRDNDNEEEERYYWPELDCDFVVPLITKPLPRMNDDDDAARSNGYSATNTAEWMNARLEQVSAQRQRVDATTTVVYMKGWGSPRNVSYVGQYWGNEGTFEIDWYRQAALIVTLPQ